MMLKLVNGQVVAARQWAVDRSLYERKCLQEA